jgi:cytochrome c biogenesis protein CcdA/thiol-disulfide isomerase/thioredoxin
MVLLVLAYVGGILTILSPCILPVLPFVFSRAGEPFLRAGLPLLVGMAAAFTGVATLAAIGGGWVVAANQYGRLAALALFALFALTLLSETLAEHLNRPLVTLGRRLSQAVPGSCERAGPWGSAILGMATGLLWAPCAGPILGLILTGAALNGASATTSLLLFAYALGAATSLALALFAGARVGALLKRSLGAGAWVRRGLGVAVLAGVALVATGLDVDLLSRIDFANTATIEEKLLDITRAHHAAASVAPERQSMFSTTGSDDDAPRLIEAAFTQTVQPAAATDAAMQIAAEGSGLPVEGSLPGFGGAVAWLNSGPLTPQALRGKVVLVNFWTFDCINCLHALPHIRAWAEKYRSHGLVVVGVHTPELPFERDIGNVRNAVAGLGITYPVPVDTSYAIWRAFGNEYWPALYFVDAEGRIRHHHFGEHDYENSERVIQELLTEAGNPNVPGGFVDASADR